MLLKVLGVVFLMASVGVGGGVVLTTSGPLADRRHDSAASQAATPTPSPSPTATLQGPIVPGQIFDFAALSQPDETSWVTSVGPSGTLSFKSPPAWSVASGQVKNALGETIGDYFQVTKPRSPSAPKKEGATLSGSVEIWLSTQPFEVPYQLLDGEHLVREFDLPNQDPGRSFRSPRVLHVRQSDKNSLFPNFRGAVTFTTPGTRIGGYYLNIFATIDMDAEPLDLAIARRIAESAEVLK